MNGSTEDYKWHLDRKVPLVLLTAILAQTLTGVWIAASAYTRLDALEHTVAGLSPQTERIIRLEERLGVVQQGISEIKLLIRTAPFPKELTEGKK